MIDLLSNTLETAKHLYAFDLYKFKTVFECDGMEFVVASDTLSGYIRIYVDGELKEQQLPLFGELYASIPFYHKGQSYRVKIVTINLLTCGVRITLYREEENIAVKEELRYGGFNKAEMGRAVIGAALLGATVVAGIELFKLILG